MFKKITLKNGLRILLVPQRGTKAVTVLVLVATGSKYEKKEISGISHFLEHLLFKGTKKRPNHIAITEPLDRVGGIYNAFTGEDYTGYFAKVKSSYFDLALDIISDIYLNSKLDPEEVEKEKNVIIEEINMRYDHPSSYVQIMWEKLLYGDQPAGWDIAGTKESVSKISRSQLLEYMKTQYTAPNTVVCVSGNLPKNCLLKIKKKFSKIRNKPGIEKPKVLENQKEPRVLLQKRKTDQTHFCLGVRGFNLFHPYRYSQELLGLILGGMMSSRIFVKVREKLGLAYYVHTSVSSNPDTGFLVTQAGVDNKKVERAILAILKEYKKISRTRVSKKELEKVKEHFKGKMTLLLETSDARASFFSFQEILERKILTPAQIYGKIDKVRVLDILKTAKEIFRPENLNLALIGPFNDEKKFKKILKL